MTIEELQVQRIKELDATVVKLLEHNAFYRKQFNDMKEHMREGMKSHIQSSNYYYEECLKEDVNSDEFKTLHRLSNNHKEAASALFNILYPDADYHDFLSLLKAYNLNL